MKRVCFLMDSIFSFGGVQRVTAVVAKQLATDHSVTIVTFDKPSDCDTTLYGLNEVNISYCFFAYPEPGRLKLMACKAFSLAYRKLLPQTRLLSDIYSKTSFPKERRNALATLLAEGHYDCIVGVHAPLATRLATMAPQLRGVRLVGWVHNSFEALYSPGSPYVGPELKRHYIRQLMKLDATVVLCQHDRQQYEAYEPRFHPTVVYNPLTLIPGKRSTGSSKRFLAVGRLSPLHKGFDLLVDAFSLFARNDSEWQLDIVGEGPEEAALRQQIAGRGMQQRIHLHPFTSHIEHYYTQAQVYVLSSRWEGFGLVLIEAMAHGLPVVSSNLPTSVELMGDFGIYFANGDVAGMADALTKATRIDWTKKSDEAVALARMFDTKSIADQWRHLLTASSPSQGKRP